MSHRYLQLFSVKEVHDFRCIWDNYMCGNIIPTKTQIELLNSFYRKIRYLDENRIPRKNT